MERAPAPKGDEQHPLLKVDGAVSDGKPPTHPSVIVTETYAKHNNKQSYFMRWPDYFSACWMTYLILSIISFFVFYTIGIDNRKHNVLVMKPSTSKPASDVYFHHIVQRGSSVPFVLYADYLSTMAMQYPLLNFHVWFLMDDSFETSYRRPRHARFFNKLVKVDDYKHDLMEFQKKYQNVNVTIMLLSKYMAMTPLRYRWRIIPTAYIPFYARIFSVWQNGGIGMDLDTYNNYYNRHQKLDRRILAILKQHNNGVKIEDYTNALRNMDIEENDLLDLLCVFFQEFINETRSFMLNNFHVPRVISDNNVTTNESLVRVRRNSEASVLENDTLQNNSKIQNTVIIDSNNDTNVKDNYIDEPDIIVNFQNFTTDDNMKLEKTNSSDDGIMDIENSNQSSTSNNKTDLPDVILFDFSIFTNSVPVPQIPFNSMYSSCNNHDSMTVLTMDAYGDFVAAISKLHPFLGTVMASNIHSMHPKLAIEHNLVMQCSGLIRDATYCKNIYLL